MVFCLQTEEREIDGHGVCRTYGIRCESGETCGDISTRREVVERLVDCFNRQQLSPVHMREAVEDFIQSGEWSAAPVEPQD